jgi:hypothetical protein
MKRFFDVRQTTFDFRDDFDEIINVESSARSDTRRPLRRVF